mgnify:CR=1 FL=1
MSDTHDKALNDAVGRALLDRLRTARDTDDMFADLDRLRHFAARGARAPLAEALTYLLKILPEDHPEHQKLTAELGSLPSAPAPARVQATPRPMKSEKVVPIPDTLPDLPDLAVVPTKADGHKCERCWKVLPDVGQDEEFGDICPRCADAVRGYQAAAE